MKIINVKSKLLKKKIIGNHRHKFASKQWEYIYVLHEDLKKIFLNSVIKIMMDL